MHPYHYVYVLVCTHVYKTSNTFILGQGSPTPGPLTSSGPWPVRNRAAQQEVSGVRASEASSAAPHHSHYRLSYASCQISGSIRFSQEQTGHKQHTSGVIVSHHPQMGPSSCRKTSSGLPLILHYGELYDYFIIYYNVIIIEIKGTINVMCLNHSKTIPPHPTPGPWKNCLPRNQSLVPKRLGAAALFHDFDGTVYCHFTSV